jgi:hypothetical protein
VKKRITFYHSALCPRCHIAGRHLKKLAASNPSLEIEKVDVLLSPRRAWRDGIRMIPAIRMDNTILSGIFLSEDAIVNFLAARIGFLMLLFFSVPAAALVAAMKLLMPGQGALARFQPFTRFFLAFILRFPLKLLRF